MVAAMMVAMGANAQKVAKVTSVDGVKFDKTAVMAATNFDKPARSLKGIKRAPASGIFGTRVATENYLGKDVFQAFGVTIEEANEVIDGETYNVKICNFWEEGTTLYGIFNEEENTLRIPNQLIWTDTSLEGLGYSDATKTYGPLEIINIDGDGKVSEEDLLFEYDEDLNVFTFDGDQTTAYYIYADGVDGDGEEVGGWTYSYDVTMSPYNGVMSFSTTSARFMTRDPREGSSWGYGELPINYEDWESSVQINGFLGSGCITVGVNNTDNTAFINMHQPLSGSSYGSDQGLMQLVGVVQDEEAGTISWSADVESIQGEVYRDVTVDDRQADAITFYGVDPETNYYTYNEYFIPLTEGQGYWMGGWFCALDLVLYKDAAAITDVKSDAQKTNKTFNLMGQQVQNAKGLVIRNGKKVVLK